jgi:hypothetical protein
MATKYGGLLADLGKRLLGFNTFSSCCAAPTAEAKAPATKPIEIVTPANAAPRTSCCAPSCCATQIPADARRV